jgi:hypothetical protein
MQRAVLALGVAVLGAADALALAVLSGAVHTTTRSTTVIESAPVPAGDAGVRRAAWSAAYARAVAGTVDVKARVTRTVVTPFGPGRWQTDALGSGVVIDGRGRILSAAHVVAGARVESPRRARRGGYPR